MFGTPAPDPSTSGPRGHLAFYEKLKGAGLMPGLSLSRADALLDPLRRGESSADVCARDDELGELNAPSRTDEAVHASAVR